MSQYDVKLYLISSIKKITQCEANKDYSWIKIWEYRKKRAFIQWP